MSKAGIEGIVKFRIWDKDGKLKDVRVVKNAIDNGASVSAAYASATSCDSGYTEVKVIGLLDSNYNLLVSNAAPATSDSTAPTIDGSQSAVSTTTTATNGNSSDANGDYAYFEVTCTFTFNQDVSSVAYVGLGRATTTNCSNSCEVSLSRFSTVAQSFSLATGDKLEVDWTIKYRQG